MLPRKAGCPGLGVRLGSAVRLSCWQPRRGPTRLNGYQTLPVRSRRGGLPAPALRMRGPRRPCRHLLRAGPQASAPPQARAVTPLGGRRGVVLTPSPISRFRSGQAAGGRPRDEGQWPQPGRPGGREALSHCKPPVPPREIAGSVHHLPMKHSQGEAGGDRLPAPEPRSTPGHT